MNGSHWLALTGRPLAGRGARPMNLAARAGAKRRSASSLASTHRLIHECIKLRGEVDTLLARSRKRRETAADRRAYLAALIAGASQRRAVSSFDLANDRAIADAWTAGMRRRLEQRR
jgi:hypothetical protein